MVQKMTGETDPGSSAGWKESTPVVKLYIAHKNWDMCERDLGMTKQ